MGRNDWRGGFRVEIDGEQGMSAAFFSTMH